MVRLFDRCYGDVRMIGLLDGDQRGKVPADVADKVCYLPGKQPMEKIFREILSAEPSHLEKFVKPEVLSEIMSALGGKDYHDWFVCLAEGVGMTEGQLFLLVFNIWIGLEEVAEEASAAFLQFAEKVS